MKKILFLLFTLFCLSAFAQENNDPNHGTIKIQKKGGLHSVLYDDVNFRLVCKDVYGNIIDSAIVSFDLNFTVKGIAYSEQIAGNYISKPMQQRLSRLDGEVILMFSNLKAKERDGKIVSLPNFKAKTGQAREQFDN